MSEMKMKLNQSCVSYKFRFAGYCYAFLAIVISLFIFSEGAYGREYDTKPDAKYVILMISDGWGIKHIEAAGKYTGRTPVYQSWDTFWMSTYPAGGGYDTELAWSDFQYVKSGATDSSASATAMYTGTKTKPSMIGVSPEGRRLFSIAEKAKMFNMAVGVVSSLQISHATPGAWYAHNDYRFNSYAIAEEGLFGDPQATYSKWNWNDKARHIAQMIFKWLPRSHKLFNDLYAGDHGISDPIEVLIGADGTGYLGEPYMNEHIREKLRSESSQPEKHTLIESVDGEDDGVRLSMAAENESITKLVGLFKHSYRLADGSGHNPENPTLAETTSAALKVLGRNTNGFGLLVEGGAVDFAAHSNNMNQMLGEQIDFDEAVEAVVDWVEDPANGSNWNNTLVIVTGDHETGYLTAGPGIFADQSLGEVSERTLSLEKIVQGSGYRASWEDVDGDGEIGNDETVYWAWNSDKHTNNLIPLYAKGFNSELLASFAFNKDRVRGSFIDNTHVYHVIDAALSQPSASEGINVNMAGIPNQIP